MSLELSSPIFIGRCEELSLFERLLDNPDDTQWILSIIGAGGQGKTQLLNKFAEIVQARRASGQNILVTAKPIDFYWTAHQREAGVLDSLANLLESADEFRGFQTELRKYRDLSPGDVDPAQLQHMAMEARARFLEGYQKLSKDKRIVLLFDTAELAGDALSGFWQNILPRIRFNTLIVSVGRQPISLLPEDQVIQIEITGFSDQEISDYLERQEVEADSDLVSRIAMLSGGRPILVAVLVDWFRDGHALSELLAYTQPEEFEKAMVDYIRKLRHPEDRAILAMAHLYRRFDEDILAHILDLSIEDATRLILSLSRFTFVKYRPTLGNESGSCLLHDAMRDMVNKYIWSALDPLGEYRLGWSSKIVSYYEDKIEVENDRLKRQSFCLERLHYWLDSNLEDAFGFSSVLFEEAVDNSDVGLMEAINAEISPYRAKLTKLMNQEVDFRTALVLYRNLTMAHYGGAFALG